MATPTTPKGAWPCLAVPGRMATCPSGAAHVAMPPVTEALRPRSCPLAVRLTWRAEQLPILVQWKMPGESMHVLGLEPANCHVEGQAAERARGSLQTLGPGQSRRFELELDISA